MGREHRTENRIGRTSITVQPAFVLVGAPGIGKRKVANELAADYFTEKLAVNEMNPAMSGVALGLRADYRTELKTAVDRATHLHSTDLPVLYTHSLIDSLAYTLARIETQITQGVGSERTRETWTLTMAVIGVMLRDTFKADETIFVRADFEVDSDQFKIQEMLNAVLDGYLLDYTIVEADNALDDVARIISDTIN